MAGLNQQRTPMKTYRSPVYPALAVRLGDKRFKFSGGLLSVPDDDVEDLDAFAAKRPEYQITEVVLEGSDAAPAGVVTDTQTRLNGEPVTPTTVVDPQPISESQLHPENVTTSAEYLENKTNAQLAEMLAQRGLMTGGNKAEHTARLKAALQEEENQSRIPVTAADA
jgi:hypothetical protein